MPKFDEFTGKFSLSKTLRFELKPIGKTWDNLERDGYLQDDKKRARNYELVKMMLDDNHREFIDKVLSTSKLDWNPLANGIILRKKNADDSSKKELEKLQKKYQKDVSTMFTKHAGFKDLLAKPALDLVKKRLESIGDVESLQSLSSFDKFSVYFSGYHEARENIYQPELKSVSIPWRIVMDNFPRFMENIQIYDKIKSEYPEIIDQLKSNLKIDDLDRYFSVDNYNNYLTQNGIEEYNYIIEGKSTETEIVQGMNVLLNLKHQKDEGFKRILMKPLFKQILSITRTKSFVPKKFENETELLSTIVKFIEDIDAAGILSTLQKLISNITSYNTDRIFIEQSNIPTLSLYIFNSWDALGGKLQSYRANQIGDPMIVKNRRPIDKWLKSPEFQLSTILDAISYSNDDFTQLIDKTDSICNNISEYPSKYSALKSVKIDNVNEEIREKSITTIRETLEPYLDLLHIAKIFSSSEELERDQTFYCDLTECVDSLKCVIQIYNQARTYCTRKSYDSSKIKVKLSLPTLADGWDLDKEKDNRALILRKDDRYFLAIMPPKSKIEFSQIQNESTSFYEKMEYKQVPGPNKMLPKIFVKAKSSKSEFGLTDEILSKYDAGMHKKGDQFDLKFCHELIDYYKSCISQYKKWDVFNFKFKDTAEYNDISEFYSDITEQAYRIDFRKIKSEDIYRYVDEGKLFLFQIYNKDFSEKSHGNKNLHTIYWNSLFSEQNLASPRIKLNGQAELFFRQRSIKEESTIVHRIGTNLVNRLDKDGKTIPPEIYKELNRFYSGNIDALSDSARKYVDKAIVTKSKYDIVKDRRFTVDKMLFHVPITFNHKCKSMAAGLNNEIIEKIIEDKEIKIIGIDRGERNLLYISMIDRNGNIICQNSLNIIDGYDYHSALDVREHGNKESRRNWTKVEGIKQLKEGYLSKVVSILSKMAIENDAIIVMEDLNYGFKKGRFKIEKQVYQAFENMMINKLNYLVFKNRNDEESGSALNGYQLTMPMTDVTKVGKQSGIIFYIPAAFTSKIDPTTGFANLFNFGSITTIEGKRSFFSKMDSIVYDNVTDSFVFEFDYRNFNTRAEDYRNNWSVYTIGHRYKFDKIHKKWVKIDPTQMIKSSLLNGGISFNGELKDSICTGTGKLINEVFDAFKQIMNMRVQNLEEDYIQSPVMNQEGAFYDSRFCQNNLPMGSDANGAYNIALKGELLLRMIESEKDGGYKIPIMTNTSWLTFIQSGKITWKN